MIEFSGRVLAKAHGLVYDQKVTLAGPVEAGTFHVQGSAERPYTVQIIHSGTSVRQVTCSCKWGTTNGRGWSECSHAAAALKVLVARLFDLCPRGCGNSMPCVDCGAGL